MNKREIIKYLAEEGPCESKAAAERVFQSVIEALKVALKTDGTVQLVGFGRFSVKQRKAREGRNPKTGEKIQIKASKTVSFRPAKGLKEHVAN